MRITKKMHLENDEEKKGCKQPLTHRLKRSIQLVGLSAKKQNPYNQTIIRVFAEKEGLQPAFVCLDIIDLAILLF